MAEITQNVPLQFNPEDDRNDSDVYTLWKRIDSSEEIKNIFSNLEEGWNCCAKDRGFTPVTIQAHSLEEHMKVMGLLFSKKQIDEEFYPWRGLLSGRSLYDFLSRHCWRGTCQSHKWTSSGKADKHQHPNPHQNTYGYPTNMTNASFAETPSSCHWNGYYYKIITKFQTFHNDCNN